MRRLTRFLALTLALVAGTPALALESWAPGKTIRILNPFPAGGTSDAISRAIANHLTGALGQSVVVENRPGGSTVIAVNELRRSPPDGTTLMYTVTGTTSQLPHLYAKPPFDPFKDFVPLGLVAYNKLVLVARANAPFDTVAGLVDYAKKNPGKVNYASFGNGSFPHIVSEALGRQAGVQMTHIPYKGGADAARSVMAGETDFLFDASVTSIANAAGGRVKLLAVVGPTRIPAVPDLPTMEEAGFPGFAEPGLEQMLAPPGTPADIADKMNAALMQAARSPEVRSILERGGFDLIFSDRKQHAEIMKKSYDYWGGVISRTGIKLD
ncbi:Bug family tripartite tricarboxylate transporter substrate binding protein [Pseudorhodoferax sp.]|uniref:Bug family tripartite tricarboxylate transporter substrate binding protein n=1 Tax=Pseudorhodoferax sp. TaxID=1993553 RepID=UPI002DD685AA|nr:tripartite tricarboxylate transporter substrate binding protein [Pseudorhodoferax sp.]